jgi:hypothetical protein
VRQQDYFSPGSGFSAIKKSLLTFLEVLLTDESANFMFGYHWDGTHS